MVNKNEKIIELKDGVTIVGHEKEYITNVNEEHTNNLDLNEPINIVTHMLLNILSMTNNKINTENLNSQELSEYIISNKEELLEQIEAFIIDKNQLIINRLDQEEKVLLQLQNMILDYNRVKMRYQMLDKKYSLLSQSKLGSLTLKYWKLKNRIPNDY